MDFPHLKDTQFPLIDNVNVYKYQNNFDYARWNGKVSFKLLNVLWNSNYADVPFFDSNVKRDEWFDGQEGYVGILESLFNSTPDNTIRIPIPYNDAYKYNYIVVDLPMQTNELNPLNYEDESIRVKRWFYFIEDMMQLSPSTTEMIISVDYWTTFIHSVEIPYLMLERGHAPMKRTTVNDYLSNPLANNEYLLADDFNYGTDTVIADSVYKPIGNGTKYVLFCAPFEPTDLALFGGSAYSGNSTAPTYSNTGSRDGYQLNVNNYAWKYGGMDYSTAGNPVKNQFQTGILNGCECYAIEGQYAKSFFNYLATHCVQMIHDIQAMFILDEALFTHNVSYNFHGYTIYVVNRKITTEAIQLTKAQFGFDSKYAEIAKLYTSPYSSLEITDDEGNTFAAKIENCGNIQMQTEVSTVYPFLNYNVLFTGINGTGSSTYTWKVVQGDPITKNMWESDFSKYMMNWSIPTYSIYVNAEQELAILDNINMQAERARAIMDYQNAVRLINTNKENTIDEQNVIYNNTIDMSNATSLNNYATAGTNKTNSLNIEAGLIDNMTDTNDTNTLITETYLNGNGRLLPPGLSGDDGFLTASAWANWEKLADDADTDWMYLRDSFDANASYFASASIINGVAGIVGSGANTASSIGGTSTAGGAGAAIVPLAGGVANAIATTVSIPLTISKDQTLTDLQQTVINDKTAHAGTNMSKALAAQTSYNKNVKDANNDLREVITKRFSDATTGINIDNINRTYDTAIDNSDRMYDTTLSSDVPIGVVNSNSYYLTNVEQANAGYTHEELIINEKARLVQKQLEVESRYKTAALKEPATFGKYGGDFAPDALQRRGVRVNIRTQNKAAIAQAGDAFLRFGYALHRVWDMSQGFNYCNYFTFWKAEDVWINDGSGVANAATDAIGKILLKGVTVWKDPTKIGTVGIYSNL